MVKAPMKPVTLSIAGSDSGGGAGIQADLRVFSRLGVYGTTAITAVTAQNLDGVHAVQGLSPEFVHTQIRAVFSGFEVKAVKTGMLWSAPIVSQISRVLADQQCHSVVVDPVMVSTSGVRLVEEDALVAYREELIPQCSLVTPNLDEAAVLLDHSDPLALDAKTMPDCARELSLQCGCSVLLKGGHLSSDENLMDVLFHLGTLHRWNHQRLVNVNNHGTGCMLSAAIAAELALGMDVVTACERGLAFVHDALSRSVSTSSKQAPLANIEEARARLSCLEHV